MPGRFTTRDPIRDSHNWYVYVGNDPINFIDFFGLDDVAAFYDRDENILEVYYADTTTGSFEEFTYTATNDVRTPEERGNEPVSYDPDGEEGPVERYNYFPEGFPDSPEEGWDMGYSYESDNPAMGPTIPTNAHRDVTTYVYNEKTLEWEESETVTDWGYSIHGGEGTTTWGCIRMSDPYVKELQPLSDAALESGGEAKLFTTGGKND